MPRLNTALGKLPPYRLDELRTVALPDLLKKLEELQSPVGVDGDVFAQLKEELARRLSSLPARDQQPTAMDSAKSLFRSRFSGQSAPYRFVSRPPAGERNRVDDLRLRNNGDGTYTATWAYKNVGDYNQDGTVDIADITPLAENFFEPADLSNEWINGNGDDVLDIADIAPLAENFFTEVAEYIVEDSPAQNGEYVERKRVSFSEAFGDGRLHFEVSLTLQSGNWVRVVPADSDGVRGVEGIPVRVPQEVNQPPVAGLSAIPDLGVAPLEVSLNASASYDPDGAIVLYEWDFEGDGVWDETGASPVTTHIYTEPNPVAYSATVRVTDDDGATDTAVASVLVMTAEAPFVNSISPHQVTEGETVTFTADVSGTPPFVFFFEFPDGGATPDFVEGSGDVVSSPPVTAGSPGNHKVIVNVSNQVGSTERDFFFEVLPAAVNRGDWWMYGREPTHQRRSPFAGPRTERIKWTYDFGAPVLSNPAIGADGTLYIGSSSGIYAINAQGQMTWKYDTINQVTASPAIGTDGTVYVPCFDGYLYAINPDGTLKWTAPPSQNLLTYSSPAIAPDGTIYVGGTSGLFYAFQPDGSVKWQYTTGEEMLSSPAIDSEGSVYIGGLTAGDSHVFAFPPEGGTPKWTFAATGGFFSSPSIGIGGEVIIGCRDNKVYALSPLDGSVIWSYEVEGPVDSSFAIGSDGAIYFGIGSMSTIYKFYALEPTGALRWSLDLDYPVVQSAPAIDKDGFIYATASSFLAGAIFALSPDGNFIWSYAVPSRIDASPVIAEDGTLYAAAWDGILRAFNDNGS